jgi:hypothetical protein
LWVEAPPVELAAVAMDLAGLDPDARRWRPDAENGRILLQHTLLGPVAERGHVVRAAYLKAHLAPGEEVALAETLPDSHRIGVNDRTTLGAVLLPVSPVISLSPDDALRFGALYGRATPPAGCAGIAAVERFERMPSGFPEYL